MGDPINANDPSGLNCFTAQSSIDGVFYGPPEGSGTCNFSTFAPGLSTPGVATYYGFAEELAFLNEQLAPSKEADFRCQYQSSCNTVNANSGAWLSVLDGVHTVLDLAGIVPGVGEAADLANAMTYGVQADPTNAALSLAAMISGGGVASAARGFRGAVQGLTGLAGEGMHAHHVFSQAFARTWDEIGLPWNSGHNGSWWGAYDHLSNAYAYNQQWGQWITDNRSLITNNPEAARAAAEGHATTIMNNFGQPWP